MAYQPAVYRQQGGDTLVVASSGTISVESGGTVTLASGSSCTVSGTLNLASGASLTVNSAATFYQGVQTLTTTQTGTQITAQGATQVTGSTTGPIYTLATPVAGSIKHIALSATSSGATHRALVYSGSTANTMGNVTGDTANQLTLATSTAWGVSLFAATTTTWRITGYYGSALPALTNYAT